MTKRNRMKKAAIKNLLLWPNYKMIRNQCTYAIRKAIQDHYHGLIEETKGGEQQHRFVIQQQGAIKSGGSP